MTTSLTINKAWTTAAASNNKYNYRTLGTSDAADATTKDYKWVTPAIDSTSRLSGNKVLVFIDIVTAASSGTPVDMFLEMSADGTNFSAHEGTGTNYITVTSDINPEVDSGAPMVYMVDLTSYNVPYFRIGINSAGNDLTAGFKCQIGFAFPAT